MKIGNWNDATVREQFVKGLISEATEGWTEKHAAIVEGLTPCVHTMIAASVVYRCIGCGVVSTAMVNKDLGERLVMIRQGLVDAQSVIESLDLDYDLMRVVQSVTVCAHTVKTSYNCSSGGNRLMCVSCGRKYSAEELTND